MVADGLRPEASAHRVVRNLRRHPNDPELFRRDIRPRLGGPNLAESMEAAGCAKSYASDVRRGKWTPHVSTRAALIALAKIEAPGGLAVAPEAVTR